MSSLAVTTDMDRLNQTLNNLAQSQLPFATAMALTNVAKDTIAAEKMEMRSVFDRPTPFSLNAFEIVPATKDKLEARVEQKYATGTSRPRNWFNPQVYSGPRSAKAFETRLRAVGILPAGLFVVPGRACPLDRYGNITGATINQVLSDLGAQRDSYQNATATSRRRNKRTRHFIVKEGGKPVGVGRRTGDSFGMVLAFVRQPSYRKRFDFFGVGERTYAERFEQRFANAFRFAMATAR